MEPSRVSESVGVTRLLLHADKLESRSAFTKHQITFSIVGYFLLALLYSTRRGRQKQIIHRHYLLSLSSRLWFCFLHYLFSAHTKQTTLFFIFFYLKHLKTQFHESLPVVCFEHCQNLLPQEKTLLCSTPKPELFWKCPIREERCSVRGHSDSESKFLWWLFHSCCKHGREEAHTNFTITLTIFYLKLGSVKASFQNIQPKKSHAFPPEQLPGYTHSRCSTSSPSCFRYE